MKANKLLPGCLAVLAMFFSACSTPPAPVSDTASPEPESPYIEAGTNHTSVPTTVYVVTNPAGQVVTDSEGETITSIGTLPPAAAPNTSAAVSSPSPGRDSNRPPQNRTTTGVTSTDRITAGQPDSATASQARTSTATESETTTTTRAITTTTQKPTESVTQPKPTGPWYAPYDLPQIYAECKREIERLEMVWEEGLRPDSLGVSWANPDNTVVYTYYPEDFNMKADVFELIKYYKDKPYTRQTCRIWLEPYEESPGDYLIYFLERR